MAPRWPTSQPRSRGSVRALRRHAIGYVGQFLRAVPRVPTLDIVVEPLPAIGEEEAAARARSARLLAQLRIPEPLWSLAPATFSGGERQRINIARGFAVDFPSLLLDEPTAALDHANRRTVVDMIRARKRDGAAIVGIFHNEEVRNAVADRLLDVGAARRDS